MTLFMLKKRGWKVVQVRENVIKEEDYEIEGLSISKSYEEITLECGALKTL